MPDPNKLSEGMTEIDKAGSCQGYPDDCETCTSHNCPLREPMITGRINPNPEGAE